MVVHLLRKPRPDHDSSSHQCSSSDPCQDGSSLLYSQTCQRLIEGVSGCLSLPHPERCRKDSLVPFILEHGSREIIEHLHKNTNARITRADGEKNWAQIAKEGQTEARMARNRDYARYMVLPDGEERKQRWRMFYKATSAKSLSTSICAICGRELMTIKDVVEKYIWSDFPGKAKLVSVQRHAAQFTLDDCLLHPQGVFVENGIIYVRACAECYNHLRSMGEGPPAFSLANGLWIGERPKELDELTVTEQKLLALIYPRLHVYKLYPKQYCGEEGLQRAMRGSLCSYPLNSEKMADMLTGKLLPRKPDVLPSLIAVLYIGVGRLPQEPLKHLLRVRREKVWNALVWLKQNNTKYYGNIEISEVTLRQLPEDDIPDQLKAVIRTTDNEKIVDEENDGYVPIEEDVCARSDGNNDFGLSVFPLPYCNVILIRGE